MATKQNKNYDFEVVIKTPDFQEACRIARVQALNHFEINEDGHSDSYDFVRSEDSLVIKFVGYEANLSMVGEEHVFSFHSRIQKCNEAKYI